MDAFRWSVVAADLMQPPVVVGISGNRDRAQEAAGAALLRDRRGIVALVEAVRPALMTPTIDVGYQPTGEAWMGRRSRGGGVHWAERAGS